LPKRHVLYGLPSLEQPDLYRKRRGRKIASIKVVYGEVVDGVYISLKVAAQ
jgi:hypothetical protein